MLFPNFEKRNQEFIVFERRKRNFPRHLGHGHGGLARDQIVNCIVYI